MGKCMHALVILGWHFDFDVKSEMFLKVIGFDLKINLGFNVYIISIRIVRPLLLVYENWRLGG